MNTELVMMFLTVVFVHFLALLSPGPDFFIVVKNERQKAIGVAAGIAIANALYIALCLVGVGAILASSVTLIITLKVIGSLFLMFLAFKALRAKRADYASIAIEVDQTERSKTTFFREFIIGFASGILNPKNLLFYLSLFTVVLTNDVSLPFKIALGIWMVLAVFFWDTAIIYLLSTKKVRKKFTKLSYYIDKITGAILGIMGISVLKSAFNQMKT